MTIHKIIEKIYLLIELYQDVKRDNLHIHKVIKEKEINVMSEIEKNELITRIKGMSKEELEVVADCIPVELCHNRIGKELKKAKILDETIMGLAAGIDA